MQVIVVAARKGGTSKSTVVQCLAIEALKEGRLAAIIDADPQGSLVKWGAVRANLGIDAPTVLAMGGRTIPALLTTLRKAGADIVFLDTPPSVSPILHHSLAEADAVIMPTLPNPMDVEALEGTWEIVHALKKTAAAIIGQAPPASQRARALSLTRERLAELGIPCCPTSITYSLSYPYAHAAGLSVQEREPASKARAELAEVWGWLKRERIV